MLEFDKHITSLLFEHNCVIIPGLGAILANPRGIQANTVLKRLEPPTKVLAFNPSLQTSDGLLIQTYARRAGISYAEAEAKVQGFAQGLKNRLQQEKKAEIKGIGNFYLTQDEKILFVPFSQANFDKSAYGLIPVRIPEPIAPTPEKTSVTETPALPENRPSVRLDNLKPKKDKKPVSSLYIWIATIALLGSLGGTSAVFVHKAGWTDWKLWIGHGGVPTVELQASEPVKSLAETSPSTENTAENNLLPASPGDTMLPIGANEPALNATPEPVPTIIPESVPVQEEQPVKGSGQYWVIAGCFREAGNAQKLMSQLRNKGYEPLDAGMNNAGLHRVAYAQLENAGAAQELLDKIRSGENPEAWLLVE